MFHHVKKVLCYTSIIAILNSSLYPLYAVQHKHNPLVDDPGSKQHRLPQQDAKAEEKSSRPIGLVLEGYLTENLQKWTPDFVKESYNDFCDWLGSSWFAQTAKEVGATVGTKTFFEIDYKNPRYWQFHFTDVLEDLKTLKPAKAKERLIELQSIVWHGLLSPFTYEKEMETLKSLKPSMKQIRKDFRSRLKENRNFLKASFARDSLRFLEDFGQQKEGIKGIVKELNSLLNYYVQVQNSLDYEESLDDLWHFVLRNRSALSLTPETYESLNDALFKAMMNAKSNRNQKEYEALKTERKIQIQKTWETRLAFEELPLYDEDSTFNSALPTKEKEKSTSFAEGAKKGLHKLSSAVKRGLTYASENPGKTIVTGLLAQTTAAAAWNAFKAPERKMHPYDTLKQKQEAEKQETYNDASLKQIPQPSPRHLKRQSGNEFQINQNMASAVFPGFPSVASLTNGNVFVTWFRTQAGLHDAYGRVFDVNGTALSNEFVIPQTITSPEETPYVASLTNGNAFVAWEGLQTGNYDLYGRIFSPNGTALTNEFGINQNTTSNQQYPLVAGLTNGNVFVAWQGFQTGDYDIYARVLSANGTAVTNEFSINQVTTADQYVSSVASLTNGDAFVAWQGQQTGNGNIYGRVFFSNGTALSDEFGINQNTTNNQASSSTAGLINGNIFVAWDGNQAGDYNIYGRLFSPNGTALTDEFGINQNTTNDQLYPFVTSLTNGNIFVTWGALKLGILTSMGDFFCQWRSHQR